MKEDNFCCNLFSDALNNVGKKGFSVLPTKAKINDTWHIYFVLQSRVIDHRTQSTISLHEVSIKYCPWCGTNLLEVIEANKNEIEEIVKTYFKYKIL